MTAKMSSKLENLARTILGRHNNDVERATPSFVTAVIAAKLIDDLAQAYLRQVAMREPGQAISETQIDVAGLTSSKRDAKPTVVKKHNRHRRRTPEEMAAAREARLIGANAVFEMLVGGRAIGKIRFGELATLKRDLIGSAARGLMLHATEVRDAVIAELIEAHCQVADQMQPVSAIVDAETLQRFVQRAEQEAPRRIEEAMRHARAAMANAELVQ